MDIPQQICDLEEDYIFDSEESAMLMTMLYALTHTREQTLASALKRIRLSLEYQRQYEPGDTRAIERLEALRAAFEALGKEG